MNSLTNTAPAPVPPLTRKEAAAFLKCCEKTLINRAIPFSKLGRLVRYDHADLVAALKKQEVGK